MWGLTAALLSSLTWATGTQAYSRLSTDYPPHVINFNRACIAFPFFMIALFIQVGPAHLYETWLQVSNQNFIWLAISMFGSYALADSLFFLSTRDLGVPVALSIGAIYPLWSALAGWFLNGEALVHIQWLGLFFAVMGVVIVILSARARLRPLDGAVRTGPLPNYVRGVGLALITSLLWSLNTFAVARGGANINPLLASGTRMCFAILLVPVSGLLLGPRKSLILSVSDYRRNGWIFIFESFGGSFFYLYGLTHAPLAMASALSSLAPVLVVPIEWAQTKRPPRLDTSIGITLVIAGVILLLIRG